MTDALTNIEKRGVAAIVDWIDTSSGVYLIQLKLIGEQFEQLSHEHAEQLGRFVSATNMRAAIATAIFERQRIDRL